MYKCGNVSVQRRYMDVGDIHGFHVFLKTEFDRLHSFARSYRAEQDDGNEETAPLPSTLATVNPVQDTMDTFLDQLGEQNPKYKTKVKKIIDDYLTKLYVSELAEIKSDDPLENIFKTHSIEPGLKEGLRVLFQKEEEAVKKIKQQQQNLKNDDIVQFFKQNPDTFEKLKEAIREIPMEKRQQIVKKVSDENPNASSDKVAENALVRLLRFALGKLKNPMTYILLASMILMCSIWVGMLTQDPVVLAKGNLKIVGVGKLPPEAGTPVLSVRDVANNIFSGSKTLVRAAVWDPNAPLITDSFPVDHVELQVANPMDNTKLTNLTKAGVATVAEMLDISPDDLEFKNKLPVSARGMFKSLQKYRELVAKYEKQKAAEKRRAQATATVKRVGVEAIVDGMVDFAWDVADAPKAAVKVVSKGVAKGGIRLLKKTGGYLVSQLVKQKVAIAADVAAAAGGYAGDTLTRLAKDGYSTRMNLGITLMLDRWMASIIVGCLLRASAWIAEKKEHYRFAMTLNATDKARYYYNAANIFFWSFALSAAQVSANEGATLLGDYTGLDFLSDLGPGQSIALLVVNTVAGYSVLGSIKDDTMSAVGEGVDYIRKAWSNRPTLTVDTIEGAVENAKNAKKGKAQPYPKNFIKDKMATLLKNSRKKSLRSSNKMESKPAAFPSGIMPPDVFATCALKF